MEDVANRSSHLSGRQFRPKSVMATKAEQFQLHPDYADQGLTRGYEYTQHDPVEVGGRMHKPGSMISGERSIGGTNRDGSPASNDYNFNAWVSDPNGGMGSSSSYFTLDRARRHVTGALLRQQREANGAPVDQGAVDRARNRAIKKFSVPRSEVNSEEGLARHRVSPSNRGEFTDKGFNPDPMF